MLLCSCSENKSSSESIYQSDKTYDLNPLLEAKLTKFIKGEYFSINS